MKPMLKLLWITLTNLAYPIAAHFIVGDFLFTSLMLALGAASAYWHFFRTRDGADWDVGMMYVILLFLIGMAFGLPPMVTVLPALPGGWAIRKKVKGRMETKIGLLTGPLLIFGFLLGAPLIPATVVLLIALGVRKWIDHGLWHPVSAVGLSLVAAALLAL